MIDEIWVVERETVVGSLVIATPTNDPGDQYPRANVRRFVPEAENTALAARLEAVTAALAAAATALWYAKIRLGIAADRMRACRAELEDDRHQLLFESDAFVVEASEAEAAARTILAAGQTAPAADPASEEPYCTEDRHIILSSGEACACGDNRTELLL